MMGTDAALMPEAAQDLALERCPAGGYDLNIKHTNNSISLGVRAGKRNTLISEDLVKGTWLDLRLLLRLRSGNTPATVHWS
jgi:hypothetical protein